jgi:microcystin-dependent protein
MVGMVSDTEIGLSGGTDAETTMTLATMPIHLHSANLQIAASSAAAAVATLPGGNVPAVASNRVEMYNNSGATAGAQLGTPGAMTIAAAGTAQPVPFSTLAPYLALTCTIATQGIFPTRS